ncbi:MAG TPA: sigma-70 family RNA polymerase sigma factor [Solirubrobacteraceae bacterium]|jgi:RNA polymerase sigma-70 factor (ECF subfamily)|nr:sigma-70 family RNA polymerase sigma factor [Solirubrobacteraceae bacterium]
MGKPELSSLADEDLMQLVRSADPDAFAVLYERHSGSSYALAYRMTGTRGAAEDVTQEAFISVWRSGARFDRSRGSVRTWVLGIVHHRAIDALRRGKVRDRPRVDDENAAEKLEAPENTELEVARRDEAATVRRAMEVLPSEQVQVIELAYFGGFTHTEIADMLDTPVGTVKGRMRLGLKKLRVQLGSGAVTL